jgi:gamma-glutamyltranspeptidase/glutathione hydrolase
VDPVAVASPLARATEAGLAAGRRGGNALDAALATAAVLTVEYPASCAIGGDLLALVRDPDGTVTFVNASGRSLAATDPDTVRASWTAMPLHGPLPVTVPGMVGGWRALWQLGAALPWSEALAAAVAAAGDGAPVSPGLAESIAEVTPLLADYPDLAAVLAPDGAPLSAGQTLRQPALARTLATLAEAGASAMYEGELADALCAGLNARGVRITSEDLRGFSADKSSALVREVGEWRVFAGRPSSQAYLVPRLLGMLVAVDADSDRPLHRRVSAARLALAFHLAHRERDEVLADPAAMTRDVEELLTDDALHAFAEQVTSHSLAALDPTAGSRRPNGDTVAVVAADSDGRSVSLIQSLFHGFGSLILEPTTGVLMHDRGACFVLDPQSPNVLAPGKRPLHTLSPVLGDRIDGRERLAVGTMGGHHQPQILTQVFSHLFAGATAQQSVGRPRLTVGAWDDDEGPDTVSWERDLDPAMVAELSACPGDPVEVAPHHSRMGHAHAIRVRSEEWDPDVGTDPRADGLP